MPQYMKRQRYSCQSVRARTTNFHSKWSDSAIRRLDLREPWYLRRWVAQARSSMVRKETVSGKSWRRKKEAKATTTVRIPSGMKLR